MATLFPMQSKHVRTRHSTDPFHVVVIGGGLAGIAAAVRLADAGVSVTLIETSKRLGGRATSFVDPTTGQVLDNCQHVVMGCCTNLLDLYQRLGVDKLIEWHRRLHFVDGRGRYDHLEADDLPAPLHMLNSLMAFRSLSLAQKLAIARGMFAMMRIGQRGRQRFHKVSFADWLSTQHQPPESIRKFWSPIVISACNERPERIAADYAMHVFQEGLLSNEKAYVMGLSRVPLVTLYDAAVRVIKETGGTVRLSCSAEQLVLRDERVVELRCGSNQRIAADAFVSGLPFDRLAKISPESMVDLDRRWQSLAKLEVSPIIGIHLWLDRDVMELPHLVLTECPLQWLFNKGSDHDGPGQKLHGVVSAAHDLIDRPADQITEMALEQVRRVIRGARAARLLHSRVIKEKKATFSAQPGIETVRPLSRGQIANMYLAGDWTRSGWPATMEGAVRSGYLAAAALLEDLNRPAHGLVADLKPGELYRVLAPS